MVFYPKTNPRIFSTNSLNNPNGLPIAITTGPVIMKIPFLPIVPLLLLSVTTTACTQDTPITQSTTPATTTIAAALPEMTVYKSAACGCCKDWVSYVEKAGYSVKAIDHDNVDSIKAAHGLTKPALKSCHTAIIDGYVIEGHVPLSDIERMLAERPDIVGLTAPGMPMMSPGMGSETPKDYDVLAFDKNSQSRIYSSY